jgi:ubiquinone biosynthesis protein UbiJ
MLRFGPDPALFRDGAVTIEGDAEAISNLKSLLGVLDFDGEEALAQVLGDTLARKAANGARLLGDWTAEITDSGAAGIAETLVEETRLLASRLRTDRFISDLDRLRDDAARLHQRINRLSSLGKPSSV